MTSDDAARERDGFQEAVRQGRVSQGPDGALIVDGPADDPTFPEVEIIRRAVTLLRARIGGATPGPWTAGSDGLVWPATIGDPVSGSTQVEDADHIAALADPIVARTIADWLDVGANPYACVNLTPMVAFARAYLREGGTPA